jgi:antitoxin MazE
MKVRISKWGNSLGLRLPKAAIDAAGLTEGSEVDVVVEGRELRLRRPVPFTQYRLEDLVAEMKRLGPENEPETVEWSLDRGSEIVEEDAYSRGEITLEDLKRPDAAGKR